MTATSPAMTASDIQKLYQHEAFSWQNPNRVRSVVGGFCMRNPKGFFAADESGFDLLLDAIIRLDQSNPQIAARLCVPFTQWQRYVPSIRDALYKRLQVLASRSDLSAGVYEIVSKSLQAAASEQ
jgi:aminopeptidase N